MARCGSCQAEIRWARTTKGKAIPLNVTQVLGGNIALDENLIARVVEAKPDVRRYVSHFATCPQADQHRQGWRKR